MSSVRAAVWWSLAVWLAVGIFWLLATRDFHPTWHLAAVTTGLLVSAYAVASYANHLALMPRYLQAGYPVRYAAALLGVMVVLTGLALAVLRASYISALGPSSVRRVEVDFAIDFFGMAVHVLCAAGVVWVFGRVVQHRVKDAEPGAAADRGRM